MQITSVEVIPLELKLSRPVRMAGIPDIDHVTAVFVRLETMGGRNAWGCTIAHPDLTREQPEDLIESCHICAEMVPSLHPTNIEYSLGELTQIVGEESNALSAFDLAFHDLLGLAAGMPLYRLLGGYRNRIQTSATIPITTVHDSVLIANDRANMGYRMLKVKGGLDPEQDVSRIKAIHRSLPDHIIRLDADGGYSVDQALDVARALKERIEMLEQPTSPADLKKLKQVTLNSPVPILADQSVAGPASALEFATNRYADSLSVKVGACGGMRCARQVDAIARAAGLSVMVSCMIEPALLVSAGLSFALSSPNVQYADLDGHLDLLNDPTNPGFHLEDGWLVAAEVPGLGCDIDLI